MKILLVTTHFFPENFKANDIAFEMAKRGHDVTVLTPIPDYPKGKFFDGYGIFKKRKEKLNGVTIIRSLVIPRHNGNALWLGLNYLSYTLFSTLTAVGLGFAKKFDTIVVHETSPVMVGIPAVIIKKMQRIPMHFWVLDLWPESLQDAGGISNHRILGVFNSLTKWIYRNSDTILIGSNGYRKSICEKGDFNNKIEYFPNWVEDVLNGETATSDIKLPSGFNVVIAGNMGDAQDLPHVMEAAKQLNGSGINFVFIGDGRKRQFVEDFVATNHMEKQVFCLGRHPLEKMPQFFRQADILFFALKDTKIFANTVPSRLQAYMSAGKPIVAMINGEGKNLIECADCGWAVPSEDSTELAKLLKKLSQADQEMLAKKGQNGKTYSDEHFNLKRCMDHLTNILTSTRN